jgi:hypothetical protein
MNSIVRIMVLGFAALIAAIVAGSAAAAFVPRISASHGTMALGRVAVNSIRVSVPRDDDALFKATIYAPVGYTYNLTQAPGVQVGTVTAQALVREPVEGTVLPLTGQIVADVPANHTTDQCAPGLHSAVWLLVLQAAGQELRVPVYVDGPEADIGFAALRLQVCLQSPYIPATAGGAAFGAKLIEAQLNINSVRGPTGPNHYIWKAAFTPWAPPATPNIAGTVEARGVISFPVTASLQLRVINPRRRIVRWSGQLTENGFGVAGVPIEVRRDGRVRARTTTTRNGSFSGTFRLSRSTTVRVQVRAPVPERMNRPTGCTDPVSLPAPAGCVSETRAFYTVSSGTVRLRVP